MERREHTRYLIWFPVTLGANDKEVWAICRDASRRGIRLSSQVPLEVGAEVTVTFRLSPEDANERVVTGRVVRIRNTSGSTWPHDLAIEFAEELPELESQLVHRSSPPPKLSEPPPV